MANSGLYDSRILTGLFQIARARQALGDKRITRQGNIDPLISSGDQKIISVRVERLFQVVMHLLNLSRKDQSPLSMGIYLILVMGISTINPTRKCNLSY
jgi:hypothetical protein